jgi:hypothetical protein
VQFKGILLQILLSSRCYSFPVDKGYRIILKTFGTKSSACLRLAPVGGDEDIRKGCSRVNMVEICTCVKIEKWDLLKLFQGWGKVGKEELWRG